MFVPGDRTGMKLGAPPRRGDLSFGAGYPARPRWPFAASDNGSSPSHRLQANRRQAGPSTQLGEKGASMPFEGSFEDRQIGRAAGRERVCQYVLISVGPVELKKHI